MPVGDNITQAAEPSDMRPESSSTQDDQGQQDFKKQRHQLKKERQQAEKRARVNRYTFLKGTGGTTGGVSGATERVRHLFIKNVTWETEDSAVLKLIEEKGFDIREFKALAHPNALSKSFKLSVPASQFDRLFDATIWPSDVLIRSYQVPKAEQS